MTEPATAQGGAAPTGPRRYASPSMTRRRTQIVETARRLIAERGPEGFTMADLGAIAGVATKTVYNLVGGKADLVAQAVGLYQAELGDAVQLPETHGLDAVLASLDETARRLLAERGWGRAIAQLYFGQDYGEEVVDRLRHVARAHFDPSIRWLAREGLLAEAAPVEALAAQFAATAYALLSDWSLGRIADDALARRLSFAMLTTLSAAATAPGQALLVARARASLDGEG